jgi:YspA, cpYpsA-related SLOG family
MIVLVTGGRDFRDRKRVFAFLNKVHAERKITFLMHGAARGADTLSDEWAKSVGVQPVAFEALWDFYGDPAGTKRNTAMLAFCRPDVVVAFPGGRGTANMMRQAYDAGIEVLDVEDYPWADGVFGGGSTKPARGSSILPPRAKV